MKNSIEYLDKIVNILEKPYFLEMRNYGVDELDEQEYVLSRVYGFDIKIYESSIIQSGKEIYFESNGNWILYEYNSNGDTIYCKNSDGDWYKYEYDEWGHSIYYENSLGKIRDER
jgi:hypothetical protein